MAFERKDLSPDLDEHLRMYWIMQALPELLATIFEQSKRQT